MFQRNNPGISVFANSRIVSLKHTGMLKYIAFWEVLELGGREKEREEG